MSWLKLSLSAFTGLLAIISTVQAQVKNYNNGQLAALGYIAAAVVAKDRCPTIKISQEATVLLLQFSKLELSDLSSLPAITLVKLTTSVADKQGASFCTEVWEAYGPNGSVAPMLLFGKLP